MKDTKKTKALQKTLDRLVKLQPINPNDYVSGNYHNLIWVCRECGNTYTRSLNNEEESLHLCIPCVLGRRWVTP